MLSHRNILFLIAAFSMTQIRIVGFIGISELAMLCFGPFVLFRYGRDLRRDGFMPLLILAGLWAASAFVTDIYRANSLRNSLRGMASPFLVLMMIPCLYVLLRDNLLNIKWAIFGFTVTLFMSTYVIQAGTNVATAEELGITAREAALEYKLTYMALVISVIKLIPILGYLKWPILSVVISLGMAVFGLLQGGRSTFLALLVGTGALALARGRVSVIRKISRSTTTLLIVMVLMGWVAKESYAFAATYGYMGENEAKKYESQAASKIGVMSGRSQFVSAFFAIRDSPVLGHGSWALDWPGYGLRAAEWLGDEIAIRGYNTARGIDWIPGHSHILTAYIWHGLFGAVFWLYVLHLLWRTFRRNLGAEPELYAYFALGLPGSLWAILFSPFGNRVSMTALIVLCLLIINRNKRGIG